ncbi:MAG: hypothetical protein R6W96_01335 [Clostridia bacterium]
MRGLKGKGTGKPGWIVLAMLLVFTILGAGFTGCQSQPPAENDSGKIAELEQTITQLEAQIKTLTAEALEPETNLIIIANRIVEHLKDKDMEGVASYVHPGKGLRFSRYGYISIENDPLVEIHLIPGLFQDTTVYPWGNYDGIGDPIELTFSDYYEKFIYDVDFLHPHLIGNNVQVGHGNSLNNVQEAYPDAVFIEFHFSGFDPEYGGMDWRSLRLVFENHAGNWKLVCILHDQWTI